MSDRPPQNVVQATGQVATNIIEGLKGQPALIFLLIVNIIVFGIAAWSGALRNERERLILERCLPKAAELGNGTMTGSVP